MATIETEGLTKFYGAQRGIEEVTIAVEPGEVFGFLGPNGAGKTTTIRTLLDLLHPSGGSARIFGLDSRRDSVAIRAPARQPARRLRLRQALHRPRGAGAAGAAARRRGARDGRRARQALPRRPRPAAGTALARQPAEGRADPRRLPPARPADPRRADQRARPADAGGVPGAGARGARARLRGLHLLPRARRGRAGVRPGGDHPRRPADRGRARRRAARQDAAPRLGRVRRGGRSGGAARAAERDRPRGRRRARRLQGHRGSRLGAEGDRRAHRHRPRVLAADPGRGLPHLLRGGGAS